MSKGEETRSQILERALPLASLGGLQNLSVGTLAAATGMSKSGLFAHFKSKEQLQLEIMRRSRQLFIDQVLAPALKQPRGEPRARALFEAFLVWDRETMPGGCIFATVGAEIEKLPTSVQNELIGSQRDLFESVATIARTAVEAGTFSPTVDPELFAFEFMSITSGHNKLHHLMRDADAETLGRRAMESLLTRSRAASATG